MSLGLPDVEFRPFGLLGHPTLVVKEWRILVGFKAEGKEFSSQKFVSLGLLAFGFRAEGRE